MRSRTNEMARSTPSPIRSITVSQETPVQSETEASQTASSSSVAPSRLIEPASPSPTSSPTWPPDVFGSVPGSKCSVASPQLEASASTKPTVRNADVRRSIGSGLRRSWNSVQPAYPSITGNRKAGPPNITKNTSEIHAPNGPIRFAIGPDWPVDENDGSPASYVASATSRMSPSAPNTHSALSRSPREML